jgi:hypothetical protein
MNYRLLVLPESDTMSVAMINRLKELIQAGASVIAAKPARAAGLASATEADAIIRARADEIWGPGIVPSAGERRLGGGRVIWGKSVAKVLAGDRIIPDFSAPAKNARYPFLYIHRETDDGSDIYYVANTDWEKKSVRAEFRVTGKVPELWNPVTGEVRRLPEFEVRDQRTIVPLPFDARESFFVIFKSGSSAPSQSAKNFPALVPALELTGPWPVAFDPAWGGPAATVFDRLTDWSTCSEKGIKYYSGTAVYTRSFDFEAPASARRVYLDLGVVRNVASVRLNGKSAGTVWSAPYRLDITGLLKPAGNQLVIEVTNLMPNRMIGDEQLPADYRLNANHTLAEIPEWLAQNRPRTSGRYTFASFNPYTKDSPLLPSGLLGPVLLQYEPDGDASQSLRVGSVKDAKSGNNQ